jgi:hypothetical protein
MQQRSAVISSGRFVYGKEKGLPGRAALAMKLLALRGKGDGASSVGPTLSPATSFRAVFLKPLSNPGYGKIALLDALSQQTFRL